MVFSCDRRGHVSPAVIALDTRLVVPWYKAYRSRYYPLRISVTLIFLPFRSIHRLRIFAFLFLFFISAPETFAMRRNCLDTNRLTFAHIFEILFHKAAPRYAPYYLARIYKGLYFLKTGTVFAICLSFSLIKKGFW